MADMCALKETKSIYFTDQECEHIKSCIAQKVYFAVKKLLNKKEFSLEGEEIPLQYRDIWQGEDYSVHINFNDFTNGSYSGCGYSTIDFSDFESAESINALIDNYFGDETTGSEMIMAGQMSLF